MSISSIARAFGPTFAEKLQDLEPGRWAGPIESGFGLHLVYLYDRRTGPVPPFEEIRPEVERAYSAAQRQAALDAYYANLRQRYEVVVLSEDDGIGRGEGR
ncbi:peptidylprolyl isomerase [Marinobacterium aestuariivivens]|uniref:peptidylprolyl isomerase n=1 Tax=Marinobacterium aestuariivivens TaxID=1698799 RepID=A0ABW2A858_9GAMM